MRRRYTFNAGSPGVSESVESDTGGYENLLVGDEFVPDDVTLPEQLRSMFGRERSDVTGGEYRNCVCGSCTRPVWTLTLYIPVDVYRCPTRGYMWYRRS